MNNYWISLFDYERRLRLAWTSGDVANQRLPAQPSQLAVVERDLNHDDVLLEYVVDDPISYCLSISPNSAFVRTLPAGRKDIEESAQAYINEIRAKKVCLLSFNPICGARKLGSLHLIFKGGCR